ncbi:ISNCY family transposase, partial [Ensifer sp. ENS07]|nr:ISNCY family transposase [Ensifer sp. ENS07]
PLAFYSDKHGVFRSLHASKKDRTSGLTQFGRALYELNIDIICEAAVRIVERWLLGRLRHRIFYSLAEVNAAIGELLHDLNDKRV